MGVVGAVAQWESTGMVSQCLWVHNGVNGSLITPSQVILLSIKFPVRFRLRFTVINSNTQLPSTHIMYMNIIFHS